VPVFTSVGQRPRSPEVIKLKYCGIFSVRVYYAWANQSPGDSGADCNLGLTVAKLGRPALDH